MTVLVDWHGRGLTDGTTLAAGTAGSGDTAVTAVTGGTATVVTGDTHTPAVEFAQTAGAADYAQWTITSGSTFAARFYLRTPSAWPSVSAALLSFRNGTTLRGRVVLGSSATNGAIRVDGSAGSQVIITPSGTLALSTWYRIEQLIDLTAGTGRLVICPNDSTTSIYDQAITGATFSGAANALAWGNVLTTATVTTRMADLTVADSDATLLGVYVPPSTPVGRTVSRWTGSARQSMKVSRWTGTTRIPHQVRT